MAFATTAELEVGVRTAIPHFTLHLLSGGPEAVEALRGSGLLTKSVAEDDPLSADDLLRIAGGRDGILVLGHYHLGSVGFILGQLHAAGRGEVHLFVWRGWTQGPMAWSREATRFLDGVAQSLGCDAIVAITPPRIAKLMEFRYGFKRTGVHLTRRVTREAPE